MDVEQFFNEKDEPEMLDNGNQSSLHGMDEIDGKKLKFCKFHQLTVDYSVWIVQMLKKQKMKFLNNYSASLFKAN